MATKFSTSVVEFIKNNPNLTYREIGEHFGIDGVTAYSWAKKAGVNKPKCPTGRKTSGKLPKLEAQASIVRPYTFSGVEKDTMFEIMSQFIKK